jgi:hypothetical protein
MYLPSPQACNAGILVLSGPHAPQITVTIGFVDPASEKERERARREEEEEEDRARERGLTPRRRDDVLLRPEEQAGAVAVRALEEHFMSGGLSGEAASGQFLAASTSPSPPAASATGDAPQPPPTAA